MDGELKALAKLLRGFAVNQIIASAVRLDLPQFLIEKDCTDFELANATGIRIDRMRLILAVLRELNIVGHKGGGLYCKTSTTDLLGSVSGRLYGQALMSGDIYYRAWADLDHTLKTGTSAFEKAFKCTMWEYLDRHPVIGDYFSRTMGAGSQLVADNIIKSLNLPSVNIIVDVGAGDGSLISAALKAYPHIRGIAFDLPGQVNNIERSLEEFNIRDRCEVVGGDFRVNIPPGGDLYLFKGVFHNWSSDTIKLMMSNLFANMNSGSRVAVIERSIPEQGEMTMHQAINSLTMLLLFGTTDRRATEYESILVNVGFLTSVANLSGLGLDVIHALKP